ncbi:BMP family ABC transporter substrate-binding protein, partial [Candidatus Calescamantes bacterium]|nr:BMP family ABC transporter substrate-binding protein [Candidatus Calescamantes bacterium]
GVDSNQNYMAPGWVLTSMVKNVDEAVYSSIEDIIKGQFTSGLHNLGLKEKGVNYALDEYNKELLDSSILKKIEDIRSKIISGEIQIVENTEE